MNYRILKIASFYKPFLKYFYDKYPEVTTRPYHEHFAALMREGHGWADFFRMHFENIGVEAFEIVHNAPQLQKAWAKENNIRADSDIISEQIKSINPDVVFFQDSISFPAEYFVKIREANPNIKLMIGYCCCPFSRQNLDAFSKMDFMLSCSPGFMEIFERHNLKNYKLLHAFETDILNRIKIPAERKNEVIFSGSFFQVSNNDFHSDRLKLVEQIINSDIPFSLYGTIESDNLPSIMAKKGVYVLSQTLKKIKLNHINNSLKILRKFSLQNKMPQRSIYSAEFRKIVKPPCYGLDMFQVTANSEIALNIHGGIAGDYAANMRMFEVAGVGTLLLTDHKKNIDSIFEPDIEIVTYKNQEECIEKMKWLIDNPNVTKRIAEAGQRRVLKDHTIKNRVDMLNEIIIKNIR